MKFYSKLFLALFILILISCASREKAEPVTPAMQEKEIYDTAQERIKSGNYSMAINSLEMLERRFPFGKYAEQAQAELIYAYYENGLFDASVAAAERFISLHPRHPNTDYAYYMKGLAKFSKEKELLSTVPLLGELTYKRDLTRAKASFEELTEFISRFPESNYIGDAKRRMLFLRSLIAKQEIEVAEFYIQRKAYIAAISRADYIIANLPNSKEVKRALEIKVQAYDLMGKDSLKKQASEVLKNFIEIAEKKETAKS
tara:strand:+ start:352 stop:1125 length:774 start_codon:yes stop_codon:yes gene_type:complete